MVIGPQGVMRSEVEGGLSGPANPIPKESIDCGCGQLPCPKLARFASRGLFVGILSCIGLLHAASQAYLFAAGSTIARRFQFSPNLMEWVLLGCLLTPSILAIPVAYWGDRIHRAAWTGGLAMVYAVGYCSMIIPHLTQSTQIIEETENVTHMSIYADDSPEICAAGMFMTLRRELSIGYVTLILLIVVQILGGCADTAYYALGISFIDDNTKKKNVAIFISIVLSVKFFGLLLGYLIAWGCLRLDADTLKTVDSYQEQIAAWWLGFPIIGLLLLIPGFIMAIFPRRLPSEVVEEAAADILESSNGSRRSSYKSYSQKIGSIQLLPSLGRLVSNKIVVFNTIAAIFAITAIVNFMQYEDIFLESRYYIPRPSGMYLGFGDPSTARLFGRIFKPIIVGQTIILAGFVIMRGRPKASYVAGYSVVITALIATLFLSLAFATCEKPSIVGEYRNSMNLLKYCNKDCRCSRDSDFRPVCDLQGKLTFYSACHAGCMSVDYVNGTQIYQDCRCVQDTLGLGNTAASYTTCSSSSCYIGWIIFQVCTCLIACLLASSAVGNIIVIFRSVFPQDKALSIGFHMLWIAKFAFIPGRMLYNHVVDGTCRYWGMDQAVCHLHDTKKLGDYLCYMSAGLTLIATVFQFFVWVFGRNLKLYGFPDEDQPPSTELQAAPLLKTPDEASAPKTSDTIDEGVQNPTRSVETEAMQSSAPPSETPQPQETPNTMAPEPATRAPQSRPLGRGQPWTAPRDSIPEEQSSASPINLDTEDELDTSSDDGRYQKKKKRSTEISYRPLELDSDVESALSSSAPRSRKKVLSKHFDPVLNNIGIASFPPTYSRASESEDEDFNVEQHIRAMRSQSNLNSLSPVEERVHVHPHAVVNQGDDGFGKTDSFEYTSRVYPPSSLDVTPVPMLKYEREAYRKTGDFNEVGIPTIDLPIEASVPPSPHMKIYSIQLTQPNFQGHMSREALDKIVPPILEEPFKQETQFPNSPLTPDGPEYTLEDVVAEPEVPRLPNSPAPQSTTSSGIGSLLLSDAEEKPSSPTPLANNSITNSRQSLNRSTHSLSSPTGDKPLLVTDF